MKLHVIKRLEPEIPVFPWKPFVIAALFFALTIGGLTGAIDLWHLRVAMQAVPLEHHRAHAFAQLFGFLGLFTMGVSLHLAPRFFGAAPATRRRRLLMASTGISGVALVVAGQLGGLLPGTAALSLSGASLLLLAMSAWAGLLVKLWQDTPDAGDALHRFLLAGVGWWWLATLLLLLWTVGQTVGGSLLVVPLESVWAMGLMGGTSSWLWGIFFRAGTCTLHVKRPPEAAQRRLFFIWQSAAVLAALSPWLQVDWLSAAANLAAAVAVAFLWWTVRPFSGPSLSQERNWAPRAVQTGLFFLLAFAALSTWQAAGVLGAWTPPLLRDAMRHAFTLGGVTMLVLGFAGRMVPGFSGMALRWPRSYDAGVAALGLAVALRLCELLGRTRAGLALAGVSGFLAWLGLALIATSLLASIRWRVGPAPSKPAPTARKLSRSVATS